MIRIAVSIICLLVAGCGSERPGAVMIRALEHTARAACEAYDGCTNRCADGRETDERGWNCRYTRRE